MSNKLQIKWTKPPPASLAKHGITLSLIDFNIIWHKENDVEVTQFFNFPDPNSKNKTILGRDYGTARRTVRGEPSEVYAQIYKNISAKDKFEKKWQQSKYIYLSKSPFHRASSDTFFNYVNNFGMTPKRFAEKTGVENSVLFRELKGQRKLSLDKAMNYAKALGCDPVDLLFEKQMCRLWGSVDLFNMNELDQPYWQCQIMPAPTNVPEAEIEGGLLGDKIIPVPRDIYRPEIKAILINSLGSYLHNHFAYYYRSDNADQNLENKMVVVGQEIPDLDELGLDTTRYFFGILKIEKGKQKLINPEPTADKYEVTTGPFTFIAPVVSLVKRGAMKRDRSYFESIEQAEQIREAEEKILQTQIKVQEELQKQLEKMQIDIKKLTELGEKEKAKIRDNLKIKNLYKSLEDIPNFIKKKVG